MVAAQYSALSLQKGRPASVTIGKGELEEMRMPGKQKIKVKIPLTRCMLIPGLS